LFRVSLYLNQCTAVATVGAGFVFSALKLIFS
jgi:hypothetical protein